MMARAEVELFPPPAGVVDPDPQLVAANRKLAAALDEVCAGGVVLDVRALLHLRGVIEEVLPAARRYEATLEADLVGRGAA